MSVYEAIHSDQVLRLRHHDSAFDDVLHDTMPMIVGPVMSVAYETWEPCTASWLDGVVTDLLGDR